VERCSGVKDVQNSLRVGTEQRSATSAVGNGATTSSSTSGAKNETDMVAPEKKHRA
jgi:hypothetical protein